MIAYKPNVRLIFPDVWKVLLFFRFAAIFFLILFYFSVSISQILPFKTYSVEDGLLSNDIEAISQDSRGYIWFGTTDGISVFDGKSFTNYTMNEGLPHNFVTQILSDRKEPGTMWILAGGNLCKYADGRFTTFKLDINILYFVYQDAYGVIWCGTDRGAFLINGNVVSPFYPSILNQNVSAITEVGNSVIWFARSKTLTHYSRFTKKFKEIEITDTANETFQSMSVDGQGNLWVVKGFGDILRIQGTKITGKRPGKFDGHSEMSANLYDTRGSNIWTFGYDGLHCVAKYQFSSAPTIRYRIENGLPENTLRSVFIDKEGNLWLGGRDKGAAKLPAWNILRFPLGSVWFVHHHQFATADSNNHLWVIAQEKLTEFWKDRFGGWHTFVHNIKRADSLLIKDFGGLRLISSLFYDVQGRLWISSLKCPGPIECYEIVPDASPHGNRPSKLRLINTIWVGEEFGSIWTMIFCFIVDRNDGLWVSIANGGIAHYDTKRGGTLLHVYNEPDKVNYIRTLYEDHSGNIWAGSFNSGLFKLSVDEISTGKFHRLTTTDGLPDNAIWDVREDRFGRTLVGTSNGGFAILDRDSIHILSLKNGLPSNKIFSMTEDSLGRLWLATSLGMIYEDRPGSKIFLRRQSFIGSSALSCGTTKNGLVWFVTPTDLFIYDYAHDVQGTTSPLVYITGLKVNGNKQAVASSVKLSYGQNNCEISFIGISFKDEGAIRYLYRLAGADNEWQDPTYSTSITYGHLDPGSYRFEVKAINIDGAGSAVPATLAITIMPPFWQAWWFSGSAIACIVLLAWFTYRIKAKRILKEKQISHEFSRELIDSQEAERNRVAGELHDGLGQELMVIINRAQMGLKLSELEAAKTQLNEIARTASGAVENVREIAYNLSPYHLEQLGLMESIKSMVEKITDSTHLRFTLDIISLLKIIDKKIGINIYRIVQECLNNIVKHSDASEVFLTAERRENVLALTVRDNGRGFNVSSVTNGAGTRKGFGLVGLSERVKLLSGTLEITSSRGEGTTVVITIPYIISDKETSENVTHE